MSNKIPEVQIYTDGACLGNPGRGGYAAVLLTKNKRKEISAGYKLTTNNRMEIMAAIMGLKTLKTKCTVIIHTDSRLLVDSIKKGWARKWQKNDWRKSNNEKALNIDLWSELLELLDIHDVTFNWIRGHAGNVENERCDELSKVAANSPSLLTDTNYENNGSNHLPQKC